MNPYLKYVSSHFLTLGIELHLVRLGSGALITVHTFAVINISLNPIKPNIGLWLSWEPSQESLIVDNIAGWKLLAIYVNQTNLNVKCSTKLGAKQRASQKPGRAMAHPGSP